MGQRTKGVRAVRGFLAVTSAVVVAVSAHASAPPAEAAGTSALPPVDGGAPLFLEPPPSDGFWLPWDLGPRGDGPVAPGAGSAPRLSGGPGIPSTVLAAYRRAEQRTAGSDPGCALPATLLAAVGRVESHHARGGQVDGSGRTLSPIVGPRLDGAGAVARIMDTDGGRHDGDPVFDRAVGPMQFIPSTWARWGADGNDDGSSDPNNVYDAALAAGTYLCAGGRQLSRPDDLRSAILSYNNSDRYLRIVLAWMNVYEGGARAVEDARGGDVRAFAASPAVATSPAPAQQRAVEPATPAAPADEQQPEPTRPDPRRQQPAQPQQPAEPAAEPSPEPAAPSPEPVCETVQRVVDPLTGLTRMLDEPVCLTPAETREIEDEGGTVQDGTVEGLPLTSPLRGLLLGL